MLDILELKPFLHNMRVLSSLKLPGATTTTRYSTHADKVSIIVMSSAEVEEISKEIRRYESISVAKINNEKLVGLQLGLWKGSSWPLKLDRQSMQDSRCLVQSRSTAGGKRHGC